MPADLCPTCNRVPLVMPDRTALWCSFCGTLTWTEYAHSPTGESLVPTVSGYLRETVDQHPDEPAYRVVGEELCGMFQVFRQGVLERTPSVTPGLERGSNPLFTESEVE